MCQARRRWPLHPRNVPPVKQIQHRLWHLKIQTPLLWALENCVGSTLWAVPRVFDVHPQRVSRGPSVPCWKAGESAVMPASSAPLRISIQQVSVTLIVPAGRRVKWSKVGSLRIRVCILDSNTHYLSIVSRWIHVESAVSRNVILRW